MHIFPMNGTFLPDERHISPILIIIIKHPPEK